MLNRLDKVGCRSVFAESNGHFAHKSDENCVNLLSKLSGYEPHICTF